MKKWLTYHDHPSRFGLIRIGCSATGVMSIQKINDGVEEQRMECSNASLSEMVCQQLDEYFAGLRIKFDFPMDLVGTEFQKKVWHALLEIPYGETKTYKEIAVAIGNPQGSRAVGLACGMNPIIIAIPCHRIIGTNGSLTGYVGGIKMKQSLLAIEQAHGNAIT